MEAFSSPYKWEEDLSLCEKASLELKMSPPPPTFCQAIVNNTAYSTQ